ncbi:20S proteasome subunit beta 1 [Enteropsectra breve]|nr:20S proteasome subunit beta 1 [Enteropsectra breve]
MEFEEVSTGTTIMAFIYRDGVILAADSRTSSGSFIDSRVTNKLTKITSNIYCCRSGSAADTQRITRYAENFIKQWSVSEGKIPSVQVTSNILRDVIYRHKDALTAGLIVAGYDESPRVFKIGPCGAMQEESIALGGSGSIFIQTFCQLNYKEDMTLEEGLAFARKAVTLAINKDNSSGGVVRMAAITKDNIQRYFVPGNRLK